jgi:hypothetical protein
MMKCIPLVAHIISKMTPLLFIGRGKHKFITSDNPVVLIDGDRTKPPYIGCGWLTKTVEAYFPISPFTCLVLMWDKEYMVIPTNEKFIPSVNSYQLWYSTRYIFSESEKIYWHKGGKIYCDDDLLFKELSHTKVKSSSTVHGPIPQVDRPFDLNLIRMSSYNG